MQQITKRAQEICRAEGLAVNDATLAALIQSANGGDIRLIVGQLQMVRRRSASLSYDQVGCRLGVSDCAIWAEVQCCAPVKSSSWLGRSVALQT